jgi:hypothetical protein
MLVEAAAEGEQFPAIRAMAAKGRDIAIQRLQKT